MIPPCYVADGVRIGAGAHVGPLVVLGAGAVIDEGAEVSESVVQSGAVVGPHAQIEYAVLVRGSAVGAGSQVRASVLGDGVTVGTGNELAGGICLWPGTVLPDGCVRFREQFRRGRVHGDPEAIFKAYDIRGLCPSGVR